MSTWITPAILALIWGTFCSLIFDTKNRAMANKVVIGLPLLVSFLYIVWIEFNGPSTGTDASMWPLAVLVLGGFSLSVSFIAFNLVNFFLRRN